MNHVILTPRDEVEESLHSPSRLIESTGRDPYAYRLRVTSLI